MVATKILDLYSTLWGPLLSDEVSGHDIIEFAQKLPELRRAFACCVCDQLMMNREVISPSACLEHFACKACRGKDRGVDRKCHKCEDWNTFEDNETLDILLKSYQRFCRNILTNQNVVRLLEVKHEVDPGFDAHDLIDLLAEGVRGAPLREPKKKLPIEVLKEGRGIIPIPVPVKKGKKAPLKDDNKSNTPNSSSSESVSSSSAVIKGSESTSDKGLNVANQNDQGDKIKQQQGVNKQTEKVMANAPPPTATTTAPVPIKLTTTVSSPAAKSSAVSVQATKSNVSSTVTKSFPLPLKSTPGSSPVVVTSASVVEKSASISSPVAKSVTVSSPVAKSFIVSTQATKSVTVPTASTSGGPVIKQEALEGMCILPDRPLSVSLEPERSPRKNSEEDTYILGLSPQTSPVKMFPAPVSNVTTATIISSSPATPTMNSMPSFKITPNLTTSGQRLGAPQYVQFSQADINQWKTVSISGQHIRLPPNFGSFPAGRIPVQVFRSQGVPISGSGIINAGGSPPLVITANMQQQQPAPNPSTSGATSTHSVSGGPSPAPPRRVFLTSATAQDLQLHRWADPNKPLQFHTGDFGVPTFGALKPNVLSVAHAALQAQTRTSLPSTSGTSGTITNVRSIPATGSLVRPITTNTTPRGLLRQQIAGTSQSMTMPHATNVQFVRTSLPGNAGPVILRTEGLASTQSPTVPSQVPASTTTPTTNNPLTTTSGPKRKQEGCRCGNATPTPGKLTCIGQRCACYAEKASCIDCKCKGCKNPYVPGGQKILPGVRTMIDPQTNQAIPLLAAPMSSVAGGHTTATFVNSGMGSTNPTIMAAIGPASNFGSIQTGGSSMQNSVQLIPIRYGPPGYTPQYIQIAGPQGLPIILSSAGGHLQASPGGGITIQGLPGMSVSGLGGLSTASGSVHQVTAPQIPRQGVVPVSGAMKIDRGLNE